MRVALRYRRERQRERPPGPRSGWTLAGAPISSRPEAARGPPTASGRPRRTSRPRQADADEWCELCGAGLPSDHRHLIHLDERRLLCACETCWSVRSGEAPFRPAGVRTEWLDDFDLPDEAWASFGIPIGLAFFMRTGEPDRVVALYPAPPGRPSRRSTPARGHGSREMNPALERLEPDSEALIVNRMDEPHQHAIAPIDDCYRLVGMIKSSWEGISGGTGPELAIEQFFAELAVVKASPADRRRLTSEDRRYPQAMSPRRDLASTVLTLPSRSSRPVRWIDAAAPTLSFRTRIRDPSGTRSTPSRSPSCSRSSPASARTTPRPASASSSSSASPSAGRRRRARSAGRRSTSSSRASPATHFEIQLPCTYDHEIAATKYFAGLSDGNVPIQAHFNGTVFYRAAGGPAADDAALGSLGPPRSAGRRRGGR